MENQSGRALGGIARAKKLAPEARSSQAKAAAAARWSGGSVKKVTHGSDDHPLKIGDIEIPCYVLEDDARVISQRGLQGGIGMSLGGAGRAGDQRLAVFMDSLAQKGHIDEQGYEAMRLARQAWKARAGASFKDYEKQVILIYESMLKTLNFDQLDDAINSVFDEYKDQVYTYTRDLILQLKTKNYLLFAISGSQTEIVAKIAAYYGFDDFEGTLYARANDRFSGLKTSHTYAVKDKVLQAMVAKHQASYKGSLAIGDSLSDSAMLELVERPIAFNPDAELYKIASSKGWRVVLERKNMIYELERKNGYYELAKTSSR